MQSRGVFNIKTRMNELLPDIPHIEAGNDADIYDCAQMRIG